MLIFKWDKNLESGINLLDTQHQKIIEVANSFFIRSKCGKDKSAVEECLKFLQQYILYHFQAEEAFQAKSAYPKRKAHQAIHNAMATKVKIFYLKITESNYSEESIKKFNLFLFDWIQNHILVEDLDFSNYYKQHKTEGPRK